MTLSKEDLENAKKAWETVKKQAQTDMDQADLYLEIILKKLESFQ